MRVLLLFASALLLWPSLTFAVFDSENDLVSLHYDHAPDRDDAHAAAAGLAVVRAMNLNVHVVAGAYGRWNADRYDAESVPVMNAVWGSDWYDAHARQDAALSSTVSRWSQTLSAGADIWVAEGGQSDFTARVVRQISGNMPTVDTRNRIHVVQHSDWNEDHADRAELEYVRTNTDYIRIEDGNYVNATADLNQKSQSFVNAVLASSYASAWQAAFAYLDPDSKLDFSDVVELLHIVGIGTDQVQSPDDFAAMFINDDAVSRQPPSSPLYWTDSYSVNGQCYCDTNFDHGLESINVDTPLGQLSVVQVCADIRRQLGDGGSSQRLYYNTVQCGHAPANDAADEMNCPGFLTDSSGTVQNYNCGARGARWNIDALYSDAGNENSGGDDSGSEETGSGDSGSEEGGPAESDNEESDNEESDNEETANEDTGSGETDNGANDGNDGGADNNTQSDSVLPVCESTDADDDDDGFGWENDRTCVVQTTVDDEAGNNDYSGAIITVGGGMVTPIWLGSLTALLCVARLRRRWLLQNTL